MYFMLLDCVSDLLNTQYLLPRFKHNEADGDFLPQSHLVITCDTINLSLELIHSVV